MGNLETSAPGPRQDEITAAEMQRLEARAFASGALSSRVAMETAGRAVAEAVTGWRWPAGAAGPVVVLCGPGNNGGDGYVIARLLNGQGWPVTVLGLGAVDAMPPDAAANRRRWCAGHGAVGDLHAPLRLPTPPRAVVDALFGIGLSRGITGPLADRLAEIAGAVAAAAAPVFAVDVPSGVDADSGRVPGAVLPADLTVTFHRPKPVHRLRPDLCGRVRVAGIGL